MKQFEVEDFTFDDDGTVEIDGIGTISGDAFDEIVAARQNAMVEPGTATQQDNCAMPKTSDIPSSASGDISAWDSNGDLW